MQEHTATGAHRNVTTPFPDGVTADVRAEARSLDERKAFEALGSFGERLGSAARAR
jgi:hypothetical protein